VGNSNNSLSSPLKPLRLRLTAGEVVIAGLAGGEKLERARIPVHPASCLRLKKSSSGPSRAEMTKPAIAKSVALAT
jgi:hypothetical protein